MNWEEPKLYAVKHKNDEIRAASRSGGVFTALSDAVFKESGLVYGCILTEDFQAVHVRAEDEKVRDKMRGSKYIESKLKDTYKNVKIDLDDNRKVLFSGTSCQVAGLKNFLQKEYKNLLCVDIVCHGVPSPIVWEKYLLWQEKKNKGKIKFVDFRNKIDYGWHSHIETLTMTDGTKVNSKIFRNLFYGHNILRPCCYECLYKSLMHPGDITIADYWGIEKFAPKFDDNRGVSLVLINNDKGDVVFNNVKEKMIWMSTRIEDSMQPPLKSPFQKPSEYDLFWKDFYELKFDYIVKKYGKNGLRNKIRRKLKTIRKKICK